MVSLIRERNEVGPTVTLALSLETIARGQRRDREPRQNPQILLNGGENGAWGDEAGRHSQGRTLERRHICRGRAPEIHLGICMNCGWNTVLHMRRMKLLKVRKN